MDTSELFTKGNLYKALAIVGVAIFVFEMFALGVVGNTNIRSNTNNQTPGNVNGTITVNATVTGYSGYIITNLHNQTIADGIAKLLGVDDVVPSSQGYVVSVANPEDVPSVYALLSDQNISGRADALVKLPPIIAIPFGNGTANVSGGEIKARIEPIFMVGDRVTISLYVEASNQVLTGYGSATILPSETNLVSNATVVALADTKTLINVPWEERHGLDVNLAMLRAKYGNGSVSYAPRDYITANGTVNGLPAYVTFTNENTYYVGNLTNKSQINADFQNPAFPDSQILVNGNASELGNYTRAYAYRYNIRIGTQSGFTYAALDSANVYQVNETVPVIVDAYAIKNRIISVIGAMELPSAG